MLEIEKKFLLASEDWKKSVVNSNILIQDYVQYNNKDARIRINLTTCKAVITHKGESTLVNNTLAREEEEFQVDFSGWLRKVVKDEKFIMKKRNYVPFHNFMFEIDEFMNLSGDKEELKIAEVEFKNQDEIYIFDDLKKPLWLGKEVSALKEYENFNLHKKVKFK